MRKVTIALLTKYYYADRITVDAMGDALSTNDIRNAYKILIKYLTERVNFGDLEIYGQIMK
jgi:hypothetical protein